MMSDRSTNRVEGSTDDVAGQKGETGKLDGGRLASSTRRRNSGTYLTHARLSEIEARLTPADWTLLATVRDHSFVTGPQLTALHFGDDDRHARAARRVLARLRDHGLLDVLERRIGGVRAGSSGLVYRLGHAGVRLLEHGQRRHAEPGQHHLRHSLAIVDVLVQLTRAERAGQLQLVRFDPEPDCWRS